MMFVSSLIEPMWNVDKIFESYSLGWEKKKVSMHQTHV